MSEVYVTLHGWSGYVWVSRMLEIFTGVEFVLLPPSLQVKVRPNLQTPQEKHHKRRKKKHPSWESIKRHIMPPGLGETVLSCCALPPFPMLRFCVSPGVELTGGEGLRHLKAIC